MRRAFLAAALLAAAILSPAQAATNIATASISRMAEPWWKARFEEKQAEIEGGHPQLIWLGDSITQNFERGGPEPWRDFAPVWAKFYAPLHAINLGFKGDSTCHLLWRIENGELDHIRPKVIVLLIGANNFGHIHTDAAQTFDGIVKVLDVIHARQPQAQVVLIHVLPSIRSTWVSANTEAVNRLMSQRLGSLGWVHQVDAAGLFTDREGHVRPDAFLDPKLTPPDPPLHPTAQTQAKLGEMIAPLIDRLLATP